jgi:broad specificity phosphatase PhoE
MTVILLRHGRSAANTAGILAGRSEGVDLDDKGREQAAGLIDRIGDLPIRALVSSPLLRCRRTVEPLAEALCLEALIDDRLAEVDYGEWTGRKIGELAGESLWKVVREHDRRLATEHGADALWVACTHGDVIKAVIADAYGMHLDGFQRVTADPSSVSVIRYTPLRPFVLHVNHTGGRLAAALRAGPPPQSEPGASGEEGKPSGAVPASDAVVGGSRD